jgi:hypothetical protein
MSPNSDSHEPDQKAGSGGNLKIIDLEFETLRQFREVMAPRLNYDGFFVATTDPLPRGTPARFRFLLPDGFVLAEGSGVVTWVRYEDEGPDLKAGMALLFDELEQQSREIIDELIDFHIATGGDPFDIGPRVSEAGDIGTDALAGDSLDVQTVPDVVESAAPESDSEPADRAATGSEDHLPEWLSEVAQKHDVDLSNDDTVPSGAIVEEKKSSPPSAPVQDFDISLFPDEEEPDPTPFQTDADGAPEVTLPPQEASKPPRDVRLKPLLAVVAVLIAASAIVFWIANRAPGGALSEPFVTLEDIPASEPPIEVAGEPAEESADKPADKPPAVSEGVPEPARAEIVTGPATRLLLVAATRVGDETVVSIRANGQLSQGFVRVSRLKDPARVWVRIQGIETFYRPNDIEVGTPEVDRVRIGHHPEETPQSIYVVFDLESDEAVVREHTIDGDTLRVVVGR